ncbi:hypothetical protein CPC16_002675, partial [Podila verticillata]
VAGLSDSCPYKGFQFLSILDDDDMILTRNQISEKSRKGISVITQKDPVQREGLLAFKILLTASSTNKVPKTRTIYSRTSSAFHASPVMVPKGPAEGPHTNPAHPAMVNQALETSLPIADIETIDQREQVTVLADGDGQESRAAVNNLHKPRSSLTNQIPAKAVPASTPMQIKPWNSALRLACTKKSLPLSKRPAQVPHSSIMFHEVPYDVHFYHHDHATGATNILKAHQVNIKKYPTLYLYVDKSQVAKNELVSKTWPTSFSSQAPIAVDISCSSYPAFEAIIEYLYTQDIDGILSKVSAADPVSYSPSPEVLGTGQTVTTAYHGLELYLDELLHVAHMFDFRELVDICVERVIATLNVDNASYISSILGEQFEEIKKAATNYISQYCDQITKESSAESDLNENYNHPQFIEEDCSNGF